ncbi:hypothetical protein C0991_003653, partial [Blastosporella zonata]
DAVTVVQNSVEDDNVSTPENGVDSVTGIEVTDEERDLLNIRDEEFEDDDIQPEVEPQLAVGIIVKQLIVAAKRHKSFGALFKLQAVQKYLELVLKYLNNPKIKNPRTRASKAVARAIGKGPYFARQIRHLKLYIEQFRTLPPTNSGKHHAHPSLLNNERVRHGVCQYLTVVALGEVSRHTEFLRSSRAY